MTPYEFASHDSEWCNRCRHNGRGTRACPIRAIMLKHPDDYAANRLSHRLKRCVQFEKKPERPKKAKEGRK